MAIFDSIRAGSSAPRDLPRGADDLGPDAAPGLESFASEHEPPPPVTPPVATPLEATPAPAPASSTRVRARFQMSPPLLAVLAVLVVVQAILTTLWLRGTFSAPPAGVGNTVNAAIPARGASEKAQVPPATAVAEPSVPIPARAASVTSTDIPEAPTKAPPVSTQTSTPSPFPPPPAAAATPASAKIAAPPAVPEGRLELDTPLVLSILARGRVLGTSRSERLALPAGVHDLDFVNSELGFRTRRQVTVTAGETTVVEIAAPTGRVHINAIPWAEVWLDGRRLGDTPLGNVAAPIGVRRLTFRHPQLGERRATVTVRLGAPAQVSVDLRSR